MKSKTWLCADQQRRHISTLSSRQVTLRECGHAGEIFLPRFQRRFLTYRGIWIPQGVSAPPSTPLAPPASPRMPLRRRRRLSVRALHLGLQRPDTAISANRLRIPEGRQRQIMEAPAAGGPSTRCEGHGERGGSLPSLSLSRGLIPVGPVRGGAAAALLAPCS